MHTSCEFYLYYSLRVSRTAFFHLWKNVNLWKKKNPSKSICNGAVRHKKTSRKNEVFWNTTSIFYKYGKKIVETELYKDALAPWESQFVNDKVPNLSIPMDFNYHCDGYDWAFHTFFL